jgi:hypothetical protein
MIKVISVVGKNPEVVRLQEIDGEFDLNRWTANNWVGHKTGIRVTLQTRLDRLETAYQQFKKGGNVEPKVYETVTEKSAKENACFEKAEKIAELWQELGSVQTDIKLLRDMAGNKKDSLSLNAGETRVVFFLSHKNVVLMGAITELSILRDSIKIELSNLLKEA